MKIIDLFLFVGKRNLCLSFSLFKLPHYIFGSWIKITIYINPACDLTENTSNIGIGLVLGVLDMT